MTSKFVPIHEHLKYKYLISMDGASASWQRVPWILLSDSVLLMVESNSRDWFYDNLKPWVHFVPIRSDFSDLFKQLHYLRNNDDLAK